MSTTTKIFVEKKEKYQQFSVKKKKKKEDKKRVIWNYGIAGYFNPYPVDHIYIYAFRR